MSSDGIDPRDGEQLVLVPTLGLVASAIAYARFRWSNEAELQAGIALVLERAALPYSREVILGPQDRIDFLVGTVGVEVKVKGAPRPVLAQLQRYAEHAEVTELLLVTGRLQLTRMPDRVHGKPLRVLALTGSLL